MQNKTTFSDLSPLGPPSSLFQEEAKLSRSLILNEFRSLPIPFGAALEKHFLARADTRNTGEVIPWLIADMIGVERSKSVERLASAWFLLHAYLLVVDDLLDEPAIENRPLLQIASGLCLQRALTGMFEVVPTALQSSQKVNQYFAKTAEAVRAELLGSDNCTAPDPTQLCQRMPGFKLWALFLLQSEEDRLVDFEASAVMLDEFVNGFQLLDDLIDWEDDWRQGRNSFLLHETFSRLERMGLHRAIDRPSVST